MENPDLMTNLEKSDSILCGFLTYNQFKWRKNNDRIFNLQMDECPRNKCTLDSSLETKLKFSKLPRDCEINDGILFRGGNSMGREPPHFCKGFQCYNGYHLSDFLLTPCPINTWKNYIIVDDCHGCSKRHQFFMNITKRK